jgi:hypothetical protein
LPIPCSERVDFDSVLKTYDIINQSLSLNFVAMTVADV